MRDELLLTPANVLHGLQCATCDPVIRRLALWCALYDRAREIDAMAQCATDAAERCRLMGRAIVVRRYADTFESEAKKTAATERDGRHSGPTSTVSAPERSVSSGTTAEGGTHV